MRSKLDEQLNELNNQMIKMGSLCETAIARVAKALAEKNLAYAKEAVNSDDEIDEKEREIEDLCLKILLQQQPVASDLRQVSSALKMITDMERIGDQAADISEILLTTNILQADHIPHLAAMAQATIRMVTGSIDAYVRHDLELAREVIVCDDEVDHYFDLVKNELVEMIGVNSAKGKIALDFLMIAKYYERIGDHATNIAEWVEFSITGRHKGVLLK